mmetsp:Transcript_2227/g.5964  ORF Transcript_2227/g.5964 Transcript_2227/m.5964 type:complete len:187 (-) Transcript_2227:181-741(-)
MDGWSSTHDINQLHSMICEEGEKPEMLSLSLAIVVLEHGRDLLLLARWNKTNGRWNTANSVFLGHGTWYMVHQRIMEHNTPFLAYGGTRGQHTHTHTSTHARAHNTCSVDRNDTTVWMGWILWGNARDRALSKIAPAGARCVRSCHNLKLDCQTKGNEQTKQTRQTKQTSQQTNLALVQDESSPRV